jgi:hypothetical protein
MGKASEYEPSLNLGKEYFTVYGKFAYPFLLFLLHTPLHRFIRSCFKNLKYIKYLKLPASNNLSHPLIGPVRSLLPSEPNHAYSALPFRSKCPRLAPHAFGMV